MSNKKTKVRDLKPKKDAKGGGGGKVNQGTHPNIGPIPGPVDTGGSGNFSLGGDQK